jgi:hypothetical protein
MDLRIEISILKLVNTENFMFGHSMRELRHFENFAFTPAEIPVKCINVGSPTFSKRRPE